MTRHRICDVFRVTTLAISLFVPSAAADLRLFLSTTGVGPTESLDPATLPVPRQNALAVEGTRLYIWADMLGEPAVQRWTGVSFDVRVNGGRVTAASLYNFHVTDPNFGDTLYIT